MEDESHAITSFLITIWFDALGESSIGTRRAGSRKELAIDDFDTMTADQSSVKQMCESATAMNHDREGTARRQIQGGKTRALSRLVFARLLGRETSGIR